ncbi:MAG: DUF998 domain-containing protein [Hyphomonadaceae bacterium]
MVDAPVRSRLAPTLLLGAVFLPVLYFGVQVALAPTFPNYNFLTDATSLLGSDQSPYAVVFNAVAFLCGICGAAGGIGLFIGLRAEGCPLILNALIAVALLLAAAGCIWAGIFPLPDPRHGANPSAPALIALPLLLAVAAFIVGGLKRWRLYFVANLVLLVVMVLVMSGVIPIDRAQYGGLLQRLLAFVAFVPIAVAGLALIRRRGRESGSNQSVG